MVYCTKCGAKNEDGANVCISCGASLYARRHRVKHRRNECFGPREEKRYEEECFGLPYGGAIAGIIFGIIILIFGFAWLADIDIWAYVGPLMVIVVGILIIAGVLYGTTRR
ncbi:zinc-ribbon domain-containing protein [Candidatus Bathyarchaeota archaeon]|nr:zinc-ribbon domain-containing protein [Candidatus Bathyarchaeota archaeon]NIV43663.1 zinc-ribbon domain-containing protein [Candidatus Bathyarchaeota archaeon]